MRFKRYQSELFLPLWTLAFWLLFLSAAIVILWTVESFNIKSTFFGGPSCTPWHQLHSKILSFLTCFADVILNVNNLFQTAERRQTGGKKKKVRGDWLKGEIRVRGCEQYMMLWVRVLVKWSQRPWRSLTLNFSGYVCIWWPLTLAPGTCLRSLRSISDASAGARTSHTYKHTQCDWAKQRISQPCFSW